MRGLVLFLVAVGLFAITDQANAQRRRRTPYAQTRSPISPYLYLGRNPQGGIDSYHTFVQPRLQLNNYIQSEYGRVNQLERQLYLRQQSQTAAPQQGLALQPLNVAEGTVAQPAQAATFMNLSHFFNPSAAGVARRGR